jgi:hypothetical protein
VIVSPASTRLRSRRLTRQTGLEKAAAAHGAWSSVCWWSGQLRSQEEGS